jgi:hypothetical protein
MRISVVASIAPKLWFTVLAQNPYRKYYLYRAPANERSKPLPQLVSMYAVIFFLGSITRYRPDQFDRIVNGKFGAQIQAVLNDVPGQFLYQLASNFCQQEVAKAAII